MVGSGSASTTGQVKPATKGETYGRVVLESTSSAERIFALSTDSLSALIQAHPDNTDNIFIGWDSDVDSDSGIVLEPGSNISIDVDLDEQNMWAIPASADDELRVLVTS